MVTILRLTHSADFDDGVPEDQRGTAVAERTFIEVTGLEAETIAKDAWPSPDLPGILRRWLDRYQPDIVFLGVRQFPYTYESVPLKIERKLRFGGRPLARIGLRSAPIFARYRAFQFLQRAAFKTIGGETHYTPDEVIQVTKDCIRCVLAKESTVLAVCGPVSWFALYEKGARVRAEQKLAYVDEELRRFCQDLGVHYLSLDAVPGATAAPGEYLANRIHAVGSVHARRSDAEGRAMAEAWQLAHAEGH